MRIQNGNALWPFGPSAHVEEPNHLGGQKHFNLLRNFSIISLSGFVLTTGLLSSFYRQQAERDLFLSTEESNVTLTQLFSNTLWSEYGPFLSSTQALSNEELVTDPMTRQLHEEVLDQLSGLSAVKVKVFDLSGRTVFSTETAQIGADKSESSGFLAAKSGEVISQLGHRDTFEALQTTLTNRHLLSSYIPIRTHEGNPDIVGVFEIYTDVTPLRLRIEQTQRSIIFGSVLLLSVLYGTLHLFVRRADRLLTIQYQQVQASEGRYRTKTDELEHVLTELGKTQMQMVHSEKMSSLGQLVAGIAHEINNPVNFIYGNLNHIEDYAQDLVKLLELYEKLYPKPEATIQAQREKIEVNFIKADMRKLLCSMKLGSKRIQDIVLSLRNFSRMDESESKTVDIHEGLESTLMMLQHRLKFQSHRPTIHIVRDFGDLPLIECYAGQLNQVFMSLLVNGIDALDDAFQQHKNPHQPLHQPPQLTIRTETRSESIVISIADNGPGMPANIKHRIFEPFFTTKEVGKGTGMGLAISYQLIAEKHHGKIECFSDEGVGTEFLLEIPIRLSNATARTQASEQLPNDGKSEAESAKQVLTRD